MDLYGSRVSTEAYTQERVELYNTLWRNQNALSAQFKELAHRLNKFVKGSGIKSKPVGGSFFYQEPAYEEYVHFSKPQVEKSVEQNKKTSVQKISNHVQDNTDYKILGFGDINPNCPEKHSSPIQTTEDKSACEEMIHSDSEAFLDEIEEETIYADLGDFLDESHDDIEEVQASAMMFEVEEAEDVVPTKNTITNDEVYDDPEDVYRKASTFNLEGMTLTLSISSKPYKLKWLNDQGEVCVPQQVRLPYSMEMMNMDGLLYCGVDPVSVNYLISSEPWQYDKAIDIGFESSVVDMVDLLSRLFSPQEPQCFHFLPCMSFVFKRTCLFSKDEKNIVLGQFSPYEVRINEAWITSNLKKERLMVITKGKTRNLILVLILSTKEVTVKGVHSIHSPSLSLIDEFIEVFPEEPPDGFPPIQRIEHLDRHAYGRSPDETKELQRHLNELLQGVFSRKFVITFSDPVRATAEKGTMLERKKATQHDCGLIEAKQFPPPIMERRPEPYLCQKLSGSYLNYSTSNNVFYTQIRELETWRSYLYPKKKTAAGCVEVIPLCGLLESSTPNCNQTRLYNKAASCPPQLCRKIDQSVQRDLRSNPFQPGRDDVLYVVEKNDDKFEDDVRVADSFFKDVARMCGVPKGIVSDQQSKFLISSWKTLWVKLGNNLLFSNTCHLQTDCQIEVTLFKMVYGYNPPTPMDLTPISFQNPACTKGKKRAEEIKEFHQQVHREIKKKNAEHGQGASKWKRRATIHSGDIVLIRLLEHRFPLISAKKIIPRSIGHYCVLEKMRVIAYKDKPPDNYSVPEAMHLIDDDDLDLRTNPFQPGENDVLRDSPTLTLHNGSNQCRPRSASSDTSSNPRLFKGSKWRIRGPITRSKAQVINMANGGPKMLLQMQEGPSDTQVN